MQFISTANHLAVTTIFPEIFLFDRSDGIDIAGIVDRTTLKSAAAQARGIVGVGLINGVSGRRSSKYYMTNFKYRGGATFAAKIDSPAIGTANLSSGATSQTALPYTPGYCSMVPKALQASSGTIPVTFPEFGMKVAYNSNGNSFSNMTIVRGAASQVMSVYSNLSGSEGAFVYTRPTSDISVNGLDAHITGSSGGHTGSGYGGQWSQRDAEVNCYVTQAGADEMPTMTDAITSPVDGMLIKFVAHELIVAGLSNNPVDPGTRPSFAFNAGFITTL